MIRNRAAATIFLVFALPSAAFAQAGTIYQGHAEQLRQRLQEILRRLRAANRGSESVHEESGAVLVAGLRAGAGAGRKGLASGRGQDQGADEGASLPSGCLQPDYRPAVDPTRLTRNSTMKRFLCLSVFVALALTSTAAFAADDCAKIIATGHPQYPVIAFQQGDDLVGAAPSWSRRSPRSSTFRWNRNSWGTGPTRRRPRATARPT